MTLRYLTADHCEELRSLHCDLNSPLHLSLFSLSICSTSILNVELLPEDGALVLAYRLIWYNTLKSHKVKKSGIERLSVISKNVIDFPTVNLVFW